MNLAGRESTCNPVSYLIWPSPQALLSNHAASASELGFKIFLPSGLNTVLLARCLMQAASEVCQRQPQLVPWPQQSAWGHFCPNQNQPGPGSCVSRKEGAESPFSGWTSFSHSVPILTSKPEKSLPAQATESVVHSLTVIPA